MSLYIDYRPPDFNEVIGNQATIKSMQTILARKNKDYPHAIMLHGPSGTGKTTVGRIWAKHLGCPPELDNGDDNMDFCEIDAAQQTGIDTARGIRTDMKYSPLNSSARVYLLDECHKMSPAFQNGMLKATEDTPKHVYFILCTTEPDKIIPTLRKRCMSFELQHSTVAELNLLAHEVFEGEGVSGITPEILTALVDLAAGAPRDLLMNMDKIIDLDPAEMIDTLAGMGVNEQQIIDLCRALIKQVPWNQVATILKGIKDDPEQVRRAVNGYMTSVLLGSNTVDERALLVMTCFSEPNFHNGKAGLIRDCAMAYT